MACSFYCKCEQNNHEKLWLTPKAVNTVRCVCLCIVWRQCTFPHAFIPNNMTLQCVSGSMWMHIPPLFQCYMSFLYFQINSHEYKWKWPWGCCISMYISRARKQHLTTLNHTHLHNSHLPVTQMSIMALSHVQLSCIRYMSHAFVLVSYFSFRPILLFIENCNSVHFCVCVCVVITSCMFINRNSSYTIPVLTVFSAF